MKCFLKQGKVLEQVSLLYSNRVSKTADALCAEDPGQPQAEDAEVMNAAFQEEEDVPLNSQTEEKLPRPTGAQPLALSGEFNFLPLFVALSFLLSVNSNQVLFLC